MAISSKSDIITSTTASAVPIRSITRPKEQKFIQVAESYSPAQSGDWSTVPSTQDAALDTLASDLSAVTSVVGWAKANWNFTDDGGGLGTIDLLVNIPDNSVIIKVISEVKTAPTSAGNTGTIRLNVPTDGNLAPALTADGAATTAFSDPDSASADVPVKTTAARSLQVTIATEAITAGDINYFVQYLVSD